MEWLNEGSQRGMEEPGGECVCMYKGGSCIVFCVCLVASEVLAGWE